MNDAQREQPTPVTADEIREELIHRYMELLESAEQRVHEERELPVSRRVPTPDAHVRIQMGAADELLVNLTHGDTDGADAP